MASAETIKKVDILINGRSYTINCPESEEPALQRAASYVNNFVQDVRKQAPQLPQEELLVLCALTLYEKSENLQKNQEIQGQAEEMVHKMLEDVSRFA